MSTFSGLSTALSGLYAQRRALDLTGQNIANVNTEGYSRQRAELQSVDGANAPAFHSRSEPGSGGVTVGTITRLHDAFLENRTRAERGHNQYLQGQQHVYASLEQAIGEPSDTGIQSQLSEFWSGWHDVANRPGDAGARTQLIARAGTIVDSLHTTYETVGALWSSTRQMVAANVEEVNQTSLGMAELNDRIAVATQAGLPVNEMSDRRDTLAMRLSELTGAAVRTRTNGTIDVQLSGASLVSGGTVRKLEVVGADSMAGQAGNKVRVKFVGFDPSAAITSGTIASNLEALGETLPNAAKGLDEVAATLAQRVNAKHTAGFDLTEPTSAPGGDFFAGTSVSTLALLITDPKRVAASAYGDNKFDGHNATDLGNLAKDAAGADVMYRTFVANLGISAQTVNRRADMQNIITEDVNAARQAASGVSLDEEMTNMLQFQRAYQAAAKVMSVVDSTLDTLINEIKR